MANVVLVPAGWTGGWCWNKVSPLLQAAGHTVYTPTLTGLGERVHLGHEGINLETHITDIVNVLEFEDLTDVTLVGWSYGGIVIAGVADQVPQRLRQVIFLDSAVPSDGQSFYDAIEDDGSIRASYHARAAAAGTSEFLPFNAEGLERVVPNPADREWMLARIVPTPLAPLDQPIRLGSPEAERLPRVYIRCIEGIDRSESEPTFLTRIRSDPGWQYRELEANHLAPISAPQATVEALLSLM